MSTDKQTAQDQLCQGPLLMVWSTQRIPCRTSWPTNFPDDTIVWFQGQDRQMIPFDRVTGALRLDVELFAETEHEAHLGPQNNQVDSANQDDGIYRIDMKKFLSWPLIAIRPGNHVPGCLLSRVTKAHPHIIFHWSKVIDSRLPLAFTQNVAWYEASNEEWIAFDRITGEVRSKIDPLPRFRIDQTAATSYEAPSSARVPDGPWLGWRVDNEPFHAFLAMNLEPIDADPDVVWFRFDMYFRACRISTGLQDLSAVPNLVVIREGLPDMSIQDYMRLFQRPSLPSNGPRENGDVGFHSDSVPRFYHSAAQGQQVANAEHHPEAFFDGPVQHTSGVGGDAVISGDSMDEEDVKSESIFHHVPPLQIGRPGEPQAPSPLGHVPTQSFSPLKPDTDPRKSNITRPGSQVIRSNHPQPRPPTTVISAPSPSIARVRKHSQAFDPLQYEPFPPVTQKRRLFDGIRYQDRPTAGISSNLGPPPRLLPSTDHTAPGPALTNTGNMPPPPISTRHPTTHPLPQVPNPSKSIDVKPPISRVDDPEGIRAVMPDEASRRQSIREFDLNAARLLFGRLAASQRKECEEMEALGR
ncbi:hypothetical protein XANCAGTX0491_007419 [Xanthoria calcicola]